MSREGDQSTLGSDPSSEGSAHEDSTLLDELPPEKLLETKNLRLIVPALKVEDDPDVLRQYLKYERTTEDREPVKRAIREQIVETEGEESDSSVHCPTSTSSSPSASENDAAGGRASKPPAPEDVLETDDTDAIRDALREVEAPTMLRDYRDYERAHQRRQSILDAIDLRLDSVS